LQKHNNSVAQVALTQLPDHPWQPWRFTKTPHYWWKSLGQLVKSQDYVSSVVLREYFLEMCADLGITSEADLAATALPITLTLRLSYLGLGMDVLWKTLFPSSSHSSSQPGTVTWGYLGIVNSECFSQLSTSFPTKLQRQVIGHRLKIDTTTSNISKEYLVVHWTHCTMRITSPSI